MRQVIYGAVFTLWGGSIVLYTLFGAPRGEGAYGAGQTGGALFGVVMFLAGAFFLFNGLRGLRSDEPEETPRKRPRKRKRKPRPIEDDDEES